ncbi:MAG: type VI secretion system lipoprotein TssJ [Psychromonas sp.]|nr:type VI secretion system lipoprotein TssJ [Psychromonas sp.]
MIFSKSIQNSLFLLVVPLMLFSCTSKNIFSSAANAIVAPSTDLLFDVAADVNPDITGRASPVVVTILQLASRAEFDNLGFFELYDNPKGSLGPDFLEKKQVEMYPGLKVKQNIKLNNGTKFIAVIVAFQDINKSNWRGVIEAYPTGYSDINVNIEKLSVYLSN